MTRIATVGHSTHTVDHFLRLLRENGMTAIADVRSSPYSRHTPQFNREALKATLRSHGMSYVFLGKELGARSDDPHHYDGVKVNYGRLSESQMFKTGIDRLLNGAEKHAIAIMCAEKDPVTCHRTILVARRLIELGAEINHILPDGSIEPHQHAMARLMRSLKIDPNDLFIPPDALADKAYRQQEERIAYIKPDEQVAAE